MALNTPWKDYIDITIEVLRPVTGAAWSPILCDVTTLHAAGGRAEWSGDVDPSVLTAVMDTVAGSVDVPSGSTVRVLLGHYQIFQGRVHDSVRNAKPDGTSLITINAADDLGALATTFLEGLDVNDPLAAVGIGDTFKERITRLLDLGGWPAAARNLDDTLNWRLEGIWLGASVLDLVKVEAQSVGAWVFLSRDGKLTTGFPDDAGAPTWMVYAKATPPGPHPICASKFTQADNLQYVVNDVFLRHHGQGLSYTMAKDTASQTKYGVRSYVREGLTNLHHLPDLATNIINHGKDPHERLSSVTIPIDRPQHGDLLDRFHIGDRLSLEYDNGHGDAFDSAEGFIVGWVLDIDAKKATLTLATGHPLDVRASTDETTVSGGGTPGSGGGGTPGATGPQGPQGVRGATWVHDDGPPTGTHPPAPAGGWMVGDQYMDKLTGKLYEYTSTGWHAEGVDLTGPEGPAGVQGIQGTIGVRGSVWSHTPTMPPPGSLAPAGGWLEGDQILHEGDGELFVYKSGAWVDEGVSILGPEGPRGPAGHIGADGTPGAAGHDGTDGVKGDAGIHGTHGDPGPVGPAGPAGHDGKGLEFLSAVPTVGDLPTIGHAGGHVGDVHLVLADGNLYTSHAGVWESVGHVQGPPGHPGADGHDGAQGIPGIHGTHGDPGPKGDPGGIGHTGAAGTPGHDGAVGAAGPRGVHGTQGATGGKGDTGAQGPRGAKGATGTISDAHGDGRYLRLDTSNDPLEGHLPLRMVRHDGSTTEHLRLEDKLSSYWGGSIVFADNGGSGDTWHIGHRGNRDAQAPGGYMVEYKHGSAYHGIIRYAINGDVMVGHAPRKGSQVRNVSHGTSGPPSGMQPGDIHLQY